MPLTVEQRRAAALKAWVTIRAKKAPAPKQGSSLLDFIHSSGGLDLRSMPGERRAWSEGGRGSRPGLFRKSRCKLTREEMMTAANDEGFGPFETERDFFDAIDNETRGKRYQTADDVARQNDDGPSSEEWHRYVSYMLHIRGVCPTCSQTVLSEIGI